MSRIALFVGALAIFAVAQPADAQVRFGPHLAWGEDTDLGIGGRLLFDLADVFGVTDGFFEDLTGQGGATYYFWDCNSSATSVDCSALQFDFDALVPFTIESSVTPYAGAGFHLARFSVDTPVSDGSETEFGVNILGGIFFDLGGLDAFAEAKLGLAGAEQLSLSAGVLFGG
jgi:opacity protein-like surface antigen